MNQKSVLLTYGILCASTIFISRAPAQVATAPESTDTGGGLMEIVVTAQKREENLQKVPISVAVINPDQLRDSGVQNTQDLAVALPGLQVLNNGGGDTPHIRGVGSGISAAGFESPVATYVDGVYYAFSGDVFAMDLSDVTQVAALKGPQGTLFGRNATGGVLQFTTLDPQQTFQGSFKTGFDNYSTTRSSAFVTGGLSESVAASLAIAYVHQDQGYGTNVHTGNPTYQEDHGFTARSKFKITIDDNTTMKWSFDYTDRAGPEYANFQAFPGTSAVDGSAQPSRKWDVNNSADSIIHYVGGGTSVTIEHDFGGSKLTSITAYRDAAHSFFFTLPSVEPLFNVLVPETSQQATEEIQLSSTTSGPLQWTVGAFYFWDKAWEDQQSYLLGLFPAHALVGDVESLPATQLGRSIAAFAQGSYSITDRTRVTAGIRYTYERKTFEGATVDAFPGIAPIDSYVTPTGEHLKFAKPTWRLSVEQDLAQDLAGYISYNRGEKSGGFSIRNPANPPFLPEQLDAYEIGVKSEMLNHRIRLNVAAFDYNYKNIQVPVFSESAYILNGAQARIYGIDLDFAASLSEHFSLTASGNWLHAKFLSFPGASFTQVLPNGAPGAGYSGNAAGNDLPYSPHFTYNIGPTYKFPAFNGEFSYNITDAYNSGFYGEPNNYLRQSAFHFLNTSLAWSSDNTRWTARIYVNNALDKAVASQISSLAGIGFIADYTNPPRIIGGDVQFRF